MQKEMSVDTLPPAIAYEVKSDVISNRRDRRSSTIQSYQSENTAESDMDVEILMADLDVSDSPNLVIRKRIAP